VERIRRSAGKWELCTARNGEFICDFLVGADGATSTTRRRLGIRFAPQDFAYSLGWRVKQIDNGHHATAAQADIKYLDGLTGYLWAFPRTDHISYGIVTKYGEATPAALKERLLDLIESQSPPIAREIKASTHHSIPRATFYGAMIPALEAESWDHLSVCNADHAWALIGDAAGFADPITGEGIYYAIKSAGLLAEALRSRAERYDEMWRAEFGAELRRAAQILRRFYHGRFAGGSFTERMVQFAQWHRGVRETLCDLIAGDQGYIDLKSRLRRAALSIV
jgi:flavin-dependent dehydrogenase